ncbi:MAG: helicase-associated domain-containing protein, partial [Planctomycetota bacterium]|nr:helicase-associated domain-containing protein [Planctomycetota bacterium]
ERVKDGVTRQFRIDDRSVHRGLVEGLTVSRMTEILTGNARTPVPKNVLQSIRGWAQQAGLLLLDTNLVVRGQDPSLMARFARDAGVRPFVRATLDSTTIQLKSKTSRQRYRTLLRDLGYLIELDGE